MTSLKRIDFTQQKFIANGKEYTITDALSIERFAEYQALSVELGYGLTIPEIHKKVLEVEQHMNGTQFVKASVVLNDLANGIKSVNDRLPTALKLCTLFVVRTDEDLSKIDKLLMDEKIEDWKKEGIDIRDFFTLATNMIGGFIELYQSLTQVTSIMEVENQAPKRQ